MSRRSENETTWVPIFNGCDPDLQPEPHWSAGVRDELTQANIVASRAGAADLGGRTVGVLRADCPAIHTHTNERETA